MGAMASQITSLTIVYSVVYSGADQGKHQSCASLAFVRGIHRRSVNSLHKRPVTWKMLPSGDVIMPNHNKTLTVCIILENNSNCLTEHRMLKTKEKVWAITNFTKVHASPTADDENYWCFMVMRDISMNDTKCMVPGDRSQVVTGRGPVY